MEIHRCCDRHNWSGGIFWGSQGRFLLRWLLRKWLLSLDIWRLRWKQPWKVWKRRRIWVREIASSLGFKHEGLCHISGAWKGVAVAGKYLREEVEVGCEVGRELGTDQGSCLPTALSQLAPQAWPSAEGSCLAQGDSLCSEATCIQWLV